MNCPTCGKYLAKGYPFCTFCKKEVVIEPEIVEASPADLDAVQEDAPPALSPQNAAPPLTMSSVEEPAASPNPASPFAAKFETIRCSRAYSDRNSTERLAQVPQIPQWQMAIAKGLPIFLLLFMIPFLAVPFLIFSVVIFGGARGFMLCPLAFFLLFFVTIASVIIFVARKVFSQTKAKTAEYERSPIEATSAIIMGRRTVVSGGGHNHHHVHHRYFITVEFEDGQRREFDVISGTLPGRIVDGDAGIVFTRGSILCDFDRVVV